jgi:MerR family transcriptional regulator, aldehyde-responsive regulator
MRNAGLTIEALIESTTLFIEGDCALKTRKNILVDERNLLIAKRAEIDATIQKLDGKIKDYDRKLLKKETDLKRRTKTETIH